MSPKQTSGFYQIDNSIIDKYGSQLGVYGVAVYNVLAKYANGNGDSIFPSYKTIANQLGISRRKVISTIEQLCDLGLVTKAQRRRKSGFNSNTYRLPKVVHTVHQVVHVMHQGSAHGAPKQYPIEQYPLREEAREAQQSARPEPQIPPSQKPKYKNREHGRAQMNVSEAANVGMDKRQLREWSDWVLEQSGKKAIADVADDDSRIGQAQQTAINLWRMGFDDADGLKDIRSWLDKSFYSAPFYSKNLENAASAICAGTAPPGGEQTDHPLLAKQTTVEFSMRELGL